MKFMIDRNGPGLTILQIGIKKSQIKNQKKISNLTTETDRLKRKIIDSLLHHQSDRDQYRRDNVDDHVKSHKGNELRNIIIIFVRADKRGNSQR
jgi:hypothetical protein